MSADEPVSIEVFYGISSPWAYLGTPRLWDIARRTGARVVLRPIRVIEANGGIRLADRPLARRRYHAMELDRWRRHLEIPLNLEPRHYPCRTIEPAAHAVIAVDRAGLDAASFSFAVQRALWAEERDIADLVTLREIAGASLGSPAEDLVRDPPTPEVADTFRRNLCEAEGLGIFGTPTYVVNGELFWGQDRLDFVERVLRRANGSRSAGAS